MHDAILAIDPATQTPEGALRRVLGLLEAAKVKTALARARKGGARDTPAVEHFLTRREFETAIASKDVRRALLEWERKGIHCQIFDRYEIGDGIREATLKIALLPRRK